MLVAAELSGSPQNYPQKQAIEIQKPTPYAVYGLEGKRSNYPTLT